MLQDPNFLNLEYFFNKILAIAQAFIAYLSEMDILGFLKALLSIIAIIFITIIIYVQIRLREIKAAHHHKAHAPTPDPEPAKRKNEKWQHVLTLGFSTNASDWRFAIIEADTMLDEMLDVMQYHGETMADKLKQVERADWKTLDEAWEAHKIRNRIAHEGSDFKLDHDEARRVLGLYERVFKEFQYI